MKNDSKKGFLIVKLRFAFLPTTFIVYPALVHCRIGSLEIDLSPVTAIPAVHCRIGSLETTLYRGDYKNAVHYRVGSLEKRANLPITPPIVHCRVGRFKF